MFLLKAILDFKVSSVQTAIKHISASSVQTDELFNVLHEETQFAVTLDLSNLLHGSCNIFFRGRN